MASPPLDARRVLAQFDQLQAEGELFYNPTTPQTVHSDGLELEFRVLRHFASKPQLASAGETTQTAQSARRPPPSDGSDIDHSDPAFFVAHVSSESGAHTHKLILNKFCVFRPQYLLLTTDATKKQTSVLDRDDLFAAWRVLADLHEPTPHYVIFNCGREGGSSRSHKHMQVLTCPDAGKGERSLQWPGDAVATCLAGKGALSGRLPLPYVVLYRALDPQKQNAFEDLWEAYQAHLKQCETELGVQGDGSLPHNIILTRDWLLTIPRRAATMDGTRGHIVNATAMIGLVWLHEATQVDGWKQTGPAQVLRTLGVPNDDKSEA